ncbi:MAG: mechanosensitive ion channel [Lentisphaerae bacterium]|nr:mechanosensitive ion channel [Lentisphaerota bacterium]
MQSFTGTLYEFFRNIWDKHQQMILQAGKTVVLVLLVLLLAAIVSRILGRIITRASAKLGELDVSFQKVFKNFAKVMVWGLALLIILDLCGINTASILTVIGAIGLAVALALKDSLSNIAAGLMLLFLRQYKTGDFVDCGTVSGSIRNMGLFCTELQTVDGIFIAVPNNVIFSAPVKNYSRNPLRRGDITVGIDYKNSLPEGIKTLQTMLENCDLILKDPAPEVLVAELADSSVNLTVRFWTANEKYWDAYWHIKAAIKPALESAGLSIPYPQRVITIVNAPQTQNAEK